MYDRFLSELFVFFLEFACLLRIFWTKNTKIDSAVVIAPLALFFSILNIFVWNCSAIFLLSFVLALLIFLTNIHSLSRFSARLLIDRYSALFLLFTIVELILTVALTVFSIAFRPVKINPDDFNSSKKTERLTGSFSQGFSVLEQSQINAKTSGFLYTYSPFSTAPDGNPLILIAGSATAEIQDYEPYLLFLSQKGFTVLAADFYSPDIKYFDGVLNQRYFRKYAARTLFLKNKQENSEEAETIVQDNAVKSYKALFELAKEKYGDGQKVFFVTDTMSFDSLAEIIESAGENYAGFFSLSSVDEYNSRGLGFVEQTDILTAKKLGLSRDKTLFIPRYVSGKTEPYLKK